MRGLNRNLFVLAIVGLVIGCATIGGSRKLIQSEPYPDGKKPEWIFNIPAGEFRGLADHVRTNKTNALTDAKMNALADVVIRNGILGEIDYANTRIERGIPEDNNAWGRFVKDGKAFFTQNLTEGVQYPEWYYEEYKTADGKTEYDVYVRCIIDKDFLRKAASLAVKQQKEKAVKEMNSEAERWANEMENRLQKKFKKISD